MLTEHVCKAYGHCYCATKHIGGKLHVECCMCEHRRCVTMQFPMDEISPKSEGFFQAALREWERDHPQEPRAETFEDKVGIAALRDRGY
jgi:hypothetical protein